MILDPRKPMLGQLARNAEESAAPEQWDRLIGTWPFVEGSGDPQDYSGYDHHGTLNGPTWTQSLYGRTLDFDGSSYVSISETNANSEMSEISCVAFGRVDETDTEKAALGRWSDGGANNQFLLRINFDNPQFFIRDSTDSNTSVGASTVNAGELVHMVGTRDASTVNLYLNGELDDSASNTNGMNSGTGPIRISGGSGGRWVGPLFIVELYDRALTPSEVRRSYVDAWEHLRRRGTLAPVLASVADTGTTTSQVPYPVLRQMMGAA